MRPSSTPLPFLDALKDQAKRLRTRFSGEGQGISHSRALELIAAQYGYRDWNTLHAAVGNRPPFNPWMLGARVRGHYLGQPFDAEVLGVQRQAVNIALKQLNELRLIIPTRRVAGLVEWSLNPRYAFKGSAKAQNQAVNDMRPARPRLAYDATKPAA